MNRMQGGRMVGKLSTAVKYGGLIAYSLMTLFPLLWILSISFRDNDQIFTSIRLIPESFKWTNYEQVLLGGNIPRAFWNSVSITTLSIVLLLFCVLTLSFAISRFRFKGASAVYLIFSAAVMVPTVTILPMTFKLFNDLHVFGFKYSIVFAYVIYELPVSIFLMVMFMRAIPQELDEASVIDGCNIWQLFTRVILPLSRNGIVTITILAFVAYWNEYLTALIMLPDRANRTLSVALSFTKDENSVKYGLMAASVMIAVIPMIIFYSIVKNQLVKGMSLGAVKG
ncbi:carbohydrate ABC transporter permease [Paenibacillus sp. WQ 127069]|uniref:Carbohydrate ABC transporter permease n=1 Tax=Paenibacillus baimaensis TaxID=2982185 RepID=A0ABT2UAJ1_9BACL|nr:carbohydrate ABC transporter permease [Paenibacillus sp. WQ 127069]MCU6790932.1 carbohydrate ABC transporter permease [Paenibacillus sp. WQ 127069]